MLESNALRGQLRGHRMFLLTPPTSVESSSGQSGAEEMPPKWAPTSYQEPSRWQPSDAGSLGENVPDPAWDESRIPLGRTLYEFLAIRFSESHGFPRCCRFKRTQCSVRPQAYSIEQCKFQERADSGVRLMFSRVTVTNFMTTTLSTKWVHWEFFKNILTDMPITLDLLYIKNLII